MLGKLIKYDLKWVYQLIIVFYLIAIFFSIFGRIFITIENSTIFSILGQICYGIAIAMMINCLINHIIRLWVRFTRNIYKDESYLTHTLPIRKKTLYLSKVLTGVISLFITILVVFICLCICYYSSENIQLLKDSLQLIATTYDSTVIYLLLSISLIFFFEMLFALLSGYLGIIVGYKANDHRQAKSVLYGFVFYLIPQLCLILLLFILGLFNPNIMNLFTTTNIITSQTAKILISFGIIAYLFYILMYYFMGKKQFEKGVNVE